MKKGLVSIGFVLLAGCGQQMSEATDATQDSKIEVQVSGLEAAAIDAGVIPDANRTSLSGAYERRSDLGVDLFCAVGNGEEDYKIGMVAIFGADSRCEARGTARRDGETLHLSLGKEQNCQFSAAYDGVQISVPGQLPEKCASYCSLRASFAGVTFSRVGEGDAVAKSLIGKDRKKLCN